MLYHVYIWKAVINGQIASLELQPHCLLFIHTLIDLTQGVLWALCVTFPQTSQKPLHFKHDNCAMTWQFSKIYRWPLKTSRMSTMDIQPESVGKAEVHRVNSTASWHKPLKVWSWWQASFSKALVPQFWWPNPVRWSWNMILTISASAWTELAVSHIFTNEALLYAYILYTDDAVCSAHTLISELKLASNKRPWSCKWKMVWYVMPCLFVKCLLESRNQDLFFTLL